jgi:hypothetical protein
MPNRSRHRLFDNVDTATGVVHEMLGDERLAQALDAGFLDRILARIAFQTLDRG